MDRFQFYHRIGSGSSKKGHENFDHVPYARDANRVIAKALIEAGTAIDYDGLGGPYDFVDAGEPAAASFRIATYDGGENPNTDLDVYVFAS